MAHAPAGHDPRYEIQHLGSYEKFDPYVSYASISGQPSVMPFHVWYFGWPHYSLPIPAYPMRPLQPDMLVQMDAPWVPHSSPVDGSWQQQIVPTRTSDIPYVRLKAPRW